MTDLPPGWASATLGELGIYLNGRGFKESEWSTCGRPIIRIQNLTGSSESFNHYSGGIQERHLVRPGDLLVSWAATLGAYVWRGPEAVLNQHIFKVRSFIDPGFHRYLIDYLLGDILKQTHGSGMVHITKSRFDETPLALPPMGEQRRIVDALEAQLSRLDTGRDALSKARSRASVIRATAFESVLRSFPSVDMSVGSLLKEPLANGRSVPTRAEGFPVLRLTALRDGYVDLRQRKGGAWTRADADQYLVQAGDFLVSRGNGSLDLLGRGGLVSDKPDLVAYPDTLIRVRLDHARVHAPFFRVVWHSRSIRRQIEQMARTTAGIYKINQVMLAGIRLPLPSMEDQATIAHAIQRTIAQVDRADAEIRGAERRTQALRRSLLSAAFKGQLVPQDPNDEPAELLLKRIRVDRAAGATRIRRPRRARATQ
jgi:type I restriction enzyme, S subunit